MAKNYGGNKNDEGKSITQTSDGVYVVAGKTSSYGVDGFDDVLVLKLDREGNIQWQKTFGGNKDDRTTSIQRTSDGGYIVAGWTESFGAGKSDIYILKLDEKGNPQW